MNEMRDASGFEKQLIRDAMSDKIPINASFELLPLCNMDCRMCYVRLSAGEAKKLGRIRSGEEWIALTQEMKKAGTLFILLTGGEPLLHPDFKEIFTALRKMGMILTVNTNGTLIDEEWADFFGKNRPRRINISLYGKDGDTYERLCGYREGFEKVKNAVEMLKSRRVDVKLNYSIVRENYRELSEVFELADSWGVPINAEAYMYPVTRERSRDYEKEIRLSPEAAAEAWIKNAL